MITQRFNSDNDWTFDTGNSYWFGLNELILNVFDYMQNRFSATLPKLRMLEIGSYMGESTAMFASSKIFSEIHCIEPFEGKEEFNDKHNYTWDKVKEEFNINTRFFNNITLHQDYSYNVVNSFEDGYFDFIYIDAAHDYKNVKRDIELCYPKLNDYGIIAGHDYHEKWPSVIKAVNETLGTPDQTYWDTSWCKTKNIEYKLVKNAIPEKTLKFLEEHTLKAKNLVLDKLGEERNVGSGTYWRGIDMASKLELLPEEENNKLFKVFSSDFMHDIISKYIPNPYFYNDQIVVKLPNEDFDFHAHYDNQYGPSPDDKDLVTLNCMLVLDDFTEENGAIKVYQKEWIKLYPKKGDILIIEGNTLHASENNNSDKPRRAYLCVYSNKPIGKDFQKGFYYKKFKKNPVKSLL